MGKCVTWGRVGVEGRAQLPKIKAREIKFRCQVQRSRAVENRTQSQGQEPAEPEKKKEKKNEQGREEA